MTKPPLMLTMLVTVAAGVALWCAAVSPRPAAEPWPPRLADRQFWSLVEDLSEPPGAFTSIGGYRSDNLMSNERSLQQVMPALLQRRRSGAYLGVGPEQNFTYITALEPAIAFVIDIRRENLLLHLMYKALAEESSDRLAFVSRLFGRPDVPTSIRDGAIDEILAAVGRTRWSQSFAAATLDAILDRLENGHGFPLTAADRAGIAAIYMQFREGPGMRWDAVGGTWIPSYAELMTATDPQGVQRSYLASEDSYRAFRRYELRNTIVPLVGDFSGLKTVRGIGRYLADRGVPVAAFYLSNVESYLRGSGRERFAENVRALPAGERSIFVRTRFGAAGYTGGRPDFKTTTMTETLRPATARSPANEHGS